MDALAALLYGPHNPRWYDEVRSLQAQTLQDHGASVEARAVFEMVVVAAQPAPAPSGVVTRELNAAIRDAAADAFLGAAFGMAFGDVGAAIGCLIGAVVGAIEGACQ